MQTGLLTDLVKVRTTQHSYVLVVHRAKDNKLGTTEMPTPPLTSLMFLDIESSLACTILDFLRRHVLLKEARTIYKN